MPSRKKPARRPAAAAKKPVRDLSTFQASHDPKIIIPGKIQKALNGMAAEGPEVYAYESTDASGQPTLTQRSGVGVAIIAQYRRQFAQYIVLARQDTGSRRSPRFVWFATANAATKARGGPVNMADFE